MKSFFLRFACPLSRERNNGGFNLRQQLRQPLLKFLRLLKPRIGRERFRWPVPIGVQRVRNAAHFTHVVVTPKWDGHPWFISPVCR